MISEWFLPVQCSSLFFTSQRCPLSVPLIDSLRSDASLCRQRGGHMSMWQEALCPESEQLVIRVGQPFIPRQQYPHGQNNEPKFDALLLQMCWDVNPDLGVMRSTSFGLEASISAQTPKHLIPAALSFYTIIGNSSCCHSAPSECWQGAFEDADQWGQLDLCFMSCPAHFVQFWWSEHNCGIFRQQK